MVTKPVRRVPAGDPGKPPLTTRLCHLTFARGLILFPMRSFSDGTGRVWQADVIEASYGSMSMLFSRLGSFDVYQSPLAAGNRLSAEHEIAAFSEMELRTRLGEAELWPGSTG